MKKRMLSLLLLAAVLMVGLASVSQVSGAWDPEPMVPDCNCTVYNCGGPGVNCPGYRPPAGLCDAVACGGEMELE